MALPKTKTKIQSDITRQNMVVYGEPKAGKTSLFGKSKMNDNILFIATEKGHDFIEGYVQTVESWPEFLSTCKDLVTEEHNYKLIVIDVADWLYKYCEDYICKNHQVEHINDLAYGKGSALVKSEFVRVINKLNAKGLGIAFIAHAKEREQKTKTQSLTVMDTSLPASASKVICGMCDYIFYVYVDSANKRFIRTKPTRHIRAGDRSGFLPELIEIKDGVSGLDEIGALIKKGQKDG